MFTSAYFWIALYVLGMFVVGYPLGYYSLKAWKYPERQLLGFVLFPLSFMFNELGKPAKGDSPSLLRSMGITPDVLNTESEEHLLIRAKYIFATMLTWPVRIGLYPLLWLAILSLLVLGGLCYLPAFGGKFLLSCKKCLRV